MKIDKTSFNVNACKEMSYDVFKKTFKHIKGIDIDSCYFQITGKKPKKKRNEKRENTVIN